MSQAEVQEVEKSRLKRVSSILVSQPEPADDKSPYGQLAKKYNLKIDFRPFIKVESVSYKEFRKDKISFLEYSAVIFTSRNSVDNFSGYVKKQKLRCQLLPSTFASQNRQQTICRST